MASCVRCCAPTLAAHHNDVLDRRRAELSAGVAASGLPARRVLCASLCWGSLARLFRTWGCGDQHGSPGRALARLCKAVAERLMTEPRQKHVALFDNATAITNCVAHVRGSPAERWSVDKERKN